MGVPTIRLVAISKREAAIDGYKCLDRIVSSHPLETKVSIETVIEQHTEDQTCRLRISSGIETSVPFLHATYALDSPPEGSNVIVWTKFEAHDVLCVLVKPTLLKIFDIFPDKHSSLVTSGDGWTLNLPFHCESMFDLGEGLLLQRQEDPQDELQGGVSSLFSLHHPLEDVLPVSLLQRNALQALLMTNAAEKMIWVGTSRYVESEKTYTEKKVCSRVLAVTYNATTRKHSFWHVHDAPKPSQTIPLYNQTRRKRDPATFNSHAVEDMQLLGLSGPTPTPHTTRDEALAEAMGVRRSPRMSLEPNTRSRQRAEQSLHQSFLSPINKSFFSEPDDSLDIHAPLQPRCAITRLFTTDASEESTKVFLLSNAVASGTLVIGILLSDEKESSQKVLESQRT